MTECIYEKEEFKKQVEEQADTIGEILKKNTLLSEEVKIKEKLIRTIKDNNKNTAHDDGDIEDINESGNRQSEKNKNKNDEESYKCNKCDYETKIKNHLLGHELKHTGQYQCLQGCKVAFKTLGELDLHINIRHGGPSRSTEFKCEMRELTFTSQHFVRQHMIKKHTPNYKTDCDNCGLISGNQQEHWQHIQLCHASYQTINSKKCRYFLKGNCLKGMHCKFLHDRNEKKEENEVPVCRNGLTCKYLARGACRYFHQKLGGSNRGSQYTFYQQNQQYHQKPRQKWCRYLENCNRVPECIFKHYEEDFPELPKTNHPPMLERMSGWEEY